MTTNDHTEGTSNKGKYKPVSIDEIHEAEREIIRIAQEKDFTIELMSLNKSKELTKTSKLYKF